MSSVIPLGIFQQVPLTTAWPTEDGNFTPWLAEPQSIAALGAVLDLELEVEAVEHWVGLFRADILARVLDDPNHRVVIRGRVGTAAQGCRFQPAPENDSAYVRREGKSRMFSIIWTIIVGFVAGVIAKWLHSGPN